MKEHASLSKKSMHELSKRLQYEVDSILVNVDEKILYAEFLDDETIDLQESERQEIFQYTSVRPIFNTMETRKTRLPSYQQHRPRKSYRSYRSKIKSGMVSFFYHLFKRFEY